MSGVLSFYVFNRLRLIVVGWNNSLEVVEGICTALGGQVCAVSFCLDPFGLSRVTSTWAMVLLICM